MQAMTLERLREPLRLLELPDPMPSVSEVMIKISACGGCRTDLHIVDGELPNPKLPIVPRHKTVGRINELAQERAPFPWACASAFRAMGDRLGEAAWLT